MPTETSRGWTPSCRSRSMRVRSTSEARIAPARCASEVRACSVSCASRVGTTITRARTPCSRASADDRGERDQRGQHADDGRPGDGHVDAGAGEPHGAAAGEERREGEDDARREDREQRQHDEAEDGRDRGTGDRSPHRRVDELVPHHAEQAAEAGPCACSRSESGQPERVEAVDAGRLEPAEAVEAVDEAEQQHEADAEHGHQAESDTEEREEHREDDGADRPRVRPAARSHRPRARARRGSSDAPAAMRRPAASMSGRSCLHGTVAAFAAPPGRPDSSLRVIPKAGRGPPCGGSDAARIGQPVLQSVVCRVSRPTEGRRR